MSGPDRQHEVLGGVSPVDLQALAPVGVSSAEQVRQAVQRARGAQQGWCQLPLQERIAALKSATVDMLQRRAEVMSLAHTEMGKVRVEAIFHEALGPLDTVSGWARVVERATRRQMVRLNPVSFPGKHAYIDAVPRGVIGIIAPWNFPVAGLYRSTIPALLTGNAIVVKPSEYTPRTSAWYLARLAAKLPKDLVQVVQGDGRVGAALIDAGIDACVFTGSPAAGQQVRVQCAQHGIPSSTEMGGKDAAIVLADCDLQRTVAGISHWALSNAGQACGAIELAYVDRRIADEFVDRMRSAWTRLAAVPVGDSLANVAPLANRRQLDIVTAQVEDARAKGAKVVCGGVPTGDGLYLPPTLLDHCDDRMSILQDETFGPVLAVVRTDGAADAVRRVNASRYGLGASIWTGDVARGKRLGERLDVGVVNINNHAFSGAIPALPWTGTKATGFGVANSASSLAVFVRPRTTTVDHSFLPDVFWMPYDRNLAQLGEILADAQLGNVLEAWKLPMLMAKRIKLIRNFFK